ncbi:uncharacterized protein LOC110893665 [Helianthus annuus]|uniref:uncharacterized protein LOC110893665 n=1 Tax=Helianthus annuus TaxID=4232 RepID=UPI001652F178|nr:uncharacterized protein LOC110893665 [Helianthus annuus]
MIDILLNLMTGCDEKQKHKIINFRYLFCKWIACKITPLPHSFASLLRIVRLLQSMIFAFGTVERFLKASVIPFSYLTETDELGKIHIIADEMVQGAVFDLLEEIAKELLTRTCHLATLLQKSQSYLLATTTRKEEERAQDWKKDDSKWEFSSSSFCSPDLLLTEFDQVFFVDDDEKEEERVQDWHS